MIGSFCFLPVSCLRCQQIFSGKKYNKGPKGRFRVSSMGLSLHLRSNACEGSCLQQYTQSYLSTEDFASSIVVAEQHAPVTQSSIPPSLIHPKTSAGKDTDGHVDSAIYFGRCESFCPEEGLENQEAYIYSTKTSLTSIWWKVDLPFCCLTACTELKEASQWPVFYQKVRCL